MGKPIAVLGDTVKLPKVGATGKIINGSSHMSNGKPIAIVGCTAEYYCPKHKKNEIATIIAGGANSADGKPIARDGDALSYCEGSDGYIICGNNHTSD
ncbi:MAG: PAAR domain-containing protein [Cetobacterium sp.]